MRKTVRPIVFHASFVVYPLAGLVALSSACLSAPAPIPAIPDTDSGVPTDASPRDSGTKADAAPPDAAPPIDSGAQDASPAHDATVTDATIADAGAGDASVTDATTVPDGTTADATLPDDSGTDSGRDANDATAPDAGTGVIHGRVLDVNQFGEGVVAGATVSVVGGPSATTDGNGRFSLSGVTPSARALLMVTAPNDTRRRVTFGTAEVAVAVAAGQTVEVNPEVLEGCIGTGPMSDAGVTLTLQSGCFNRSADYASVSVDPLGLLTADGGVMTGIVRLEVIPLGFEVLSVSDAGTTRDLSWVRALPGDMSGTTSDGGATRIDVAGAVELRLLDDTSGLPLTIAPGHTATIAVESYSPQAADGGFAAGHYDPYRGLWVTAGPGSFTTATVGDTVFPVMQTAVSELGWWNIQRPLASAGCLRGTLTAGSAPVARPLLAGTGADFLGPLTQVPQAPAGAFCMDGPAALHANLSGTAIGPGGLTYTLSAPGASLSSAGTSCESNIAQCTDLGTIALALAPVSAYSGKAVVGVPDGGAPVVTPITIYSNPNLTLSEQQAGYADIIHLGEIVPDDAGEFCTSFAPGVNERATHQGPAPCVLSGQGDIALYPPSDAGPAACGTDAALSGDIFFGCS